MFYLADNALDAHELEILADLAIVEPDGWLYYQRQRKRTLSRQYNACEILLQWQIPEESYGVQRIRCGHSKPLSKAKWATRLDANGYLEKLTEARAAQITQVFVGQDVEFAVLGWRLLNIGFWNPRTALKIKAAPNAVVEVFTRATRNFYPAVAQSPHEKKKAARRK